MENSNTDLKSPDIKKEKIWTSARNVIIKKVWLIVVFAA